MKACIAPEKIAIGPAHEKFDVMLLPAKDATCCVLFAAGLGGNPEYYLDLLNIFSLHGISVVAPYFALLPSPFPVGAELLERSQRLALARQEFCSHAIPVTGIGHSLGTVILLMHAGAKASTSIRETVCFDGGSPLSRLVLLAPAADFFRAPDSLNQVNLPVQIWAGHRDSITPPSQAKFLQECLTRQTETELHTIKEAGHFTFMSKLPPHVTDPHPARETALAAMGEKIVAFTKNAAS